MGDCFFKKILSLQSNYEMTIFYGRKKRIPSRQKACDFR